MNLTLSCLYVISILASFLFSVNAAELVYHGYYRAGVGTNTKGGDQTCFSAPGAPSNQFRLGNECSNYGEIGLVMAHMKNKRDPSKNTRQFFNTHLLLAFSQNGDTDWESANSGGQPIVVRELYFSGGKFNGADLSFWVGKRFLREQDMYMNDWYYFADTSGNGGGVEGAKLLGGDLMLSYLKETSSTSTNLGKLATTHYDIRLKNIPIMKNQFINLWLDYAFMPDARGNDGKSYASIQGLAAGVLLETRPKSGFNHLSFVYGKGLLQNLGLNKSSPVEVGSSSYKTLKNKERFRLVEHLTIPLSVLQLHFMAAYEYIKPKSLSEPIETHFFNTGISPVYYFDDHYHISGVLGGSFYTRPGLRDQAFARVTIAPGISIGNSIWSRPTIRAFYTHSFWGKSSKGNIGGTEYSNTTTGGSFGIQGESWF